MLEAVVLSGVYIRGIPARATKLTLLTSLK